jgi:hypothetical protein
MNAPRYGSCACTKRVQLDARGRLRPHQVPIHRRQDPKKSERCPRTEPLPAGPGDDQPAGKEE